MNALHPTGGFELALETSGRWGGVALARAGVHLETLPFPATTNHAAQLMPTARELCAKHGCVPGDIGVVHVSVGPGSFTGLRVGVATARMLALALGARLTAVPTLEVIAQNALQLPAPPAHAAVFIDAKRSHAYAQAFELSGVSYRPLAPPVEADPVRFMTTLPPNCALLGDAAPRQPRMEEASGAARLSQEMDAPDVRQVLRLGQGLASAGRYTPARELVPVYVRRVEAEERWEARHAAG